MSAAALLAPAARPPHDPLWITLGGCRGWSDPVAATQIEVEAGGEALVLTAASGAARLLSESNGSLGGLRPPRNVAVDCEGAIWLLGGASGLLRRFDPCDCRFVTVLCTLGTGSGPRHLMTPAGIAAADSTLFVCDAGPPGRLLVFDRRSFALRAVWRPPSGAVANPWSPQAIVVDRAAALVADKANGGVHRFARWGGWLGFWGGLGAIEVLALDCRGRLYAVVPGAANVPALTNGGGVSGRYARPAEVAGFFPPAPFPVFPDGTIDLRGICPQPDDQGFGSEGDPVKLPPPPNPLFATSGEWIVGPLDSGIAQCVWHRLCADAIEARPGQLRFASYTAEVVLPDADIALLPASAWTDVPTAPSGHDALILSRAGRYLWLRIGLSGDGATTPRLCAVTLEYPRISLRRYLPAAFGSDPISADFTDRLLAIFDRGYRDIETRIDDGAALFDADSAPDIAGYDILGWIGAWLGLALERGWPAARRRALVKAAGKLFACRGTPKGLRDILLLWLGWNREWTTSRRPPCAPRCRPPDRQPEMPKLILEHWRLRRWLWLGKGRLGFDAMIWGETLLGRSQIDGTARTGATRLDVTRNPLLDPFNIAANRFSIFLPARHVSSAVQRAQITRLIDEYRPADVLQILVPVHARMRIGIQASIGFDAVVGCWPSGVTLDEARLGRGTVLSGVNPGGVTARIGRTTRFQPARTPASARQGECMA